MNVLKIKYISHIYHTCNTITGRYQKIVISVSLDISLQVCIAIYFRRLSTMCLHYMSVVIILLTFCKDFVRKEPCTPGYAGLKHCHHEREMPS